jgi:phosphohistidine phosphatase
LILYFLRHGIAEDRAADGTDHARSLTSDGESQLRAAADVWRRLNLRPDVVFTSPLPRAQRTAELLVDALELSHPPIADDGLAPGAGWSSFAQLLAQRPADRRVLFVGHEPDLSQAIELLTGASSVRMRKAGLACLEFYGVPEAGGGEIAWLLDPDLYDTSPTDA